MSSSPRQKALAAGAVKYTSSKPCPRGHVGERYVLNGSCVQCHRGHYSKKHWTIHDRSSYQARYYRRLREQEPERIIWSTAKRRAKKNNIPFELRPADIRDVWPADGLCPVLGIPLLMNEGGSYGPNSPSLDRVIPEIGYRVGNIALISMRANLVKSGETDPDIFRRVADWLERIKKS